MKTKKKQRLRLRDKQIYVATLINPVNKKLYVVTVGQYNRVQIWDPNDPVHPVVDQHRPRQLGPNSGAFLDADTTGPMAKIRKKTGYVRSHCPGGVNPPGIGLGLILYMGLALCAKAADLMNLKSSRQTGITKNVGGKGIFSDPADRTGAASAFWDDQVRRGLARRGKVKGYTRPGPASYVDFLDADAVIKSGLVLDLSRYFWARHRPKISRGFLAKVDVSTLMDQNVAKQLARATRDAGLAREADAYAEPELTQEHGVALINPILWADLWAHELEQPSW